MRRIGFRFQLRTMILLVAVVGLSIGAETMRRRWRYHHAQAAKFGEGEQLMLQGMKSREAKALLYRKRAEDMEKPFRRKAPGEPASFGDWYRNDADRSRWARFYRHFELENLRDLAGYRQSAAEWRQLRLRHEYAASRPWLRLEIEPFPF